MTRRPDDEHRPAVRRGEGEDGRWIEVEIEVPGTPEQVWEAIATGPGISAWFVPTEVEPGEGGTVSQDHGEGIDAAPAHIVAWEPPRRLKIEDREWQPTPGSPAGALATEYLVEARSGGTCVVRLVSSGFGEGAAWDRTYEGNAIGWRSALETLRLYLTHFRGEEATSTGAWAEIAGDPDAAARELRWALGVEGKQPGEEIRSAPPAPPLHGVLEALVAGQAIVRIDEPARGLAFIATGGPGDETYAMVRMKLFGGAGDGVDEQAWQRWIEEHVAAA